MIRLLGKGDLFRRENQSPLALLWALEFAAYKNRYPFSQVLGVYSEEDETLTGGISLCYESAVAWAKTPAASGEIGTYLAYTSSWETLICDQWIERAGGFSASFPAQRVWHLTAVGIHGGLAQEAAAPKRAEIYRLLVNAGREPGELSFDGWYCDVSHRARRGLNRSYGIYRQGTLACTLTASLLGEDVMISDVATHPAFWGQGLCKKLLGHARHVYEGKRLHLLTTKEETCKIYERCGFLLEQEHFIKIHKENAHATTVF